MENYNYYNNTAFINQLWYESHSKIIEMVANELGESDKVDDLIQKFIGKPMKLKKFKDPNKPKRAKTSYIYFCIEMRLIIKKECPDLKFGQIMKELGKRWNNLPKKLKEKYENLHDDDVNRYEEDMNEYYENSL